MSPDDLGNLPEIENALVEMEGLLRRTHAYDHANQLESLIDLLHENQRQAIECILSKEFWGPAGSYFDLIISDLSHHVSDDFVRDNIEYRRLLLCVLHGLRAEGYTRPDFDWIERMLAARREPFVTE